MKEENLPEHKASLTIRHNEHKDYYQTVKQFLDEREQMMNIEDDDWATPTSKERAMATDSLWELRWYPNTPVGFNMIFGATLEEVLLKAKD